MHPSNRLTVTIVCLVAINVLDQPWHTWAADADWPTFGRGATRNAVVPKGNGPTDWDVTSGRNVKWKARLGEETFAAPVVSGGQVYIGTNNGAGYLERYPKSIDLGCLLCFRESDGQFIWQYSAEKLPIGRVHDWPHQGLVSSPLVEGDRLWFVSNRHVVVCLDAQGFRDQENSSIREDATRREDCVTSLHDSRRTGRPCGHRQVERNRRRAPSLAVYDADVARRDTSMSFSRAHDATTLNPHWTLWERLLGCA
jgi:hypothetical protein